jgi:regulator of protease activity HflC (stomatin/prohibitin superfamily)
MPLWLQLSLGLFFAGGITAVGYQGVQIVPQGWRYTVQRLGKYTRSLEPGMGFIMPLYESISNKVDIRQQHMDLKPQKVITGDSASVEVDAVVFYEIVDVVKSTYSVTDLEGSIVNWVATAIRGGMGSMTLSEVLSQRDRITNELLEDADDVTNPWGVKIHRVKIKDIKPPEDVLLAMSEQLKAEKQKQAAISRAEGEQKSIELVAQGKKTQARLEAEAKKITMFAEAEANRESARLEAEGRLDIAKAEAEATRLMSEAISKGSIQAVNYFIAQKYITALSEMASANNHKVLLMPLEASHVLGALSGIAEIAKEAFQDKPLNLTSTLPSSEKLTASPPTTPTKKTTAPTEKKPETHELASENPK